MKQNSYPQVKVIIYNAVDFWAEYLTILKIFVQPDPTNLLIFQLPEVFKVRFTDTINNCIGLEKTIYNNLIEVKPFDISFYLEYHYDLEAQMQTINKTSAEIFLNNDPHTIPPKRKYIVSFLQGELVKLGKLIRSMSAKLTETEISEVDRILTDKMNNLKNVIPVDLPPAILNTLKIIDKSGKGFTPENLLSFMQNKATVFLLYKLKDTETLSALIGSGEGHINNVLASITSGDFNFLLQVVTSPKAKEEIGSLIISEAEEKQVFIGNKDFYKAVYGYFSSVYSGKNALNRRRLVHLIQGKVSINEVIKHLAGK